MQIWSMRNNKRYKSSDKTLKPQCIAIIISYVLLTKQNNFIRKYHEKVTLSNYPKIYIYCHS